MPLPDDDSIEHSTGLSSLDEFDGLSEHIANEAPDLETGISMLEQAYGSYSFDDQEAAKNKLSQWSTTLNQRFQSNYSFDPDQTMQVAPIQPAEIIPIGDTDNDKTVNFWDQWEEKNLKAVAESDSAAYVMGRNQLERSIRQTATLQRRAVLGGDNDYFTEGVYRVGQGLTKGFTDLAGTSNFFENRTNPELDDSLWTGLLQGVGQVGGGIAVGAAAVASGGTAAPAAAGYFLLQGAGSVRNQYEEAKDSGASTLDAVAAAGIEAASQGVQSLVGGKIFGNVGARLLKTETRLGAKILLDAAKSGAAEALAEGGGQIASNYATHVGQGVEFEPWQGVGKAALIGGILGAGADVVVEGRAHLKGPHVLPSDAVATKTEAKPQFPGETDAALVGGRFADEVKTELDNLFVERQVARTEAEATGVKEGNFLRYSPEAVDKLDAIDSRIKELEGELKKAPTREVPAQQAEESPEQIVQKAQQAEFEAAKPIIEQQIQTISRQLEEAKARGDTKSVERLEYRLNRATENLAWTNKQTLQRAAVAVENTDGVPPPPKETISEPRRSVDLGGTAQPVVRLADNNSYVTDGEKIYLQAGDKTLHTYDHTFYVKPEIAKAIAQAGHTPDGAEVAVFSEGGKLVIETVQANYMNPDGTINYSAATKASNDLNDASTSVSGGSGKTRHEIKTEEGAAPGLYVVQANQVRTSDGVRTTGFMVSPAPITELSQSMGAADINELWNKETKPHAGWERLLKEYGPLWMEKTDLGIESSTTGKVYPTNPYLPKTFEDAAQEVQQVFQQDGGPLHTMARILTQDRFNDTDSAAVNYMIGKVDNALMQAWSNVDYETADRMTALKGELEFLKQKVGEPMGRGLRWMRPDAQEALGLSKGDIEVTRLSVDLMREAQTEIEKEFGQGTTIQKLKAEADAADVESTEAGKAETDPIDQKLRQYDEDYKKAGNADVERLQGEINNWKIINQSLLEDLKAAHKKLKSDKRDADVEAKELAAKEEAKVQAKTEAIDIEITKIKVADLEGLQQAKEQLTKQVETLQRQLTDYEMQRLAATPIEELDVAKQDVTKAEDDIAVLTDKRDGLHRNDTRRKQVNEQLVSARKVLTEAKKKVRDLEKQRTQAGKPSKDEANTAKVLESSKETLDTVSKLLDKGQVSPETEALIKKKQAQKEALQKSKLEALDNLAKKTERVKSIKPGEVLSDKVKEVRAARKKVRELQKEAKQPRPENAKQAKVRTEKEAFEKAKAEGRVSVKLTPEQQERITVTREKARVAKERLTKAEQILKEKLAKLNPEDRARLKSFYDLLAKTPRGEAHHKLSVAIFNMEAKLLPKGDVKASERLFNFFRGNILSGPDTHFRNFWGNATNAISTVAAATVTGGPVQGYMYAKGWMKGLTHGFMEAREIMHGRRRGRLKAESASEATKAKSLSSAVDPDAEPLTAQALTKPLDDLLAGKPLTAAKGLLVDTIPEVSRRLLSASDAVFYRSAVNGHAYLLEYIAAKHKGLKTVRERIDFVQDQMFQTKAGLKEVTDAVNKQSDLLKSVGLEMTEDEKSLAIFEEMERRKDRRIRELNNKHGERAVLIQEMDGLLGGIGKTILAAQDVFRPKVFGKEIPVANFLFPFVRTTANIGNMYLDHTPVGFLRAAALKSKYKADVQNRIDTATKSLDAERLKAKPNDTTIASLEKEIAAAQEDMVNPNIGVEARLVMGKAMIGSAMVASMFAAAFAGKDEEKPDIEFYADHGKNYRKMSQMGIPQYSVRKGDLIIPLQNTPLALVAAIIGGGMKAIKSGADPEKVAINAATAWTGAFATLTTIKPIADLFNVLNGGDVDTESGVSSSRSKSVWNQIKTQAVSFSSGFFPSSGLLKNISKWMQAAPQETYNNFSAKLAAITPGAAALGVGKPQINMFGEPIERNILDRTAIGTSLFTYRKTDPVFLWMQETGYKITEPGPIIRMSEKETKYLGKKQMERVGYQDILDEEQSYELVRRSGPQIKAYVERIMKLPQARVYNERTQDSINEAVSTIRARVRRQILFGR